MYNTIYSKELDSIKRYWLNNAKNLVESLKKVYGEIALKVISQQFEDLNIFEKKLLGHRESLIRKIMISNSDQILVFARTAIPKNFYYLFLSEINSLGTKPIGNNLLFKKELFNRSTFIIRELSNNNFKEEIGIDDKHLKCNSLDTIYSRSSIFEFKDNNNIKIAVTEYLLLISEITYVKS